MNYLDQAGTFGTPTRLGHEPADPGDLRHWRHLSEVETTTMLDVVVPVHNEEIDLAPAVSRLHRYLQEQLPYSFRITIADNASTDGTAALADQLADSFEAVRAVHLDAKGRGRALNTLWSASNATVPAPRHQGSARPFGKR